MSNKLLSLGIKHTKPVNFLPKTESYLQKNYSPETIQAVLPIIQELDVSRRSISSLEKAQPEDYPQLLDSLALYYRFITAVEPRLPLASIGLELTWHDSLSKSKMSEKSFQTEKTSILFNIAALYSKIAALQNLSVPDEGKLALNYFQLAAGCLEEIRNSEFEFNFLDLSHEYLTCMVEIFIAQAYFCMFEKLDKASANKVSLAKLSSTIGKEYEKAAEIMSSDPLSRNLDNNLKNLINFEKNKFLAYANFFNSFGDREQGATIGRGFGIGVSRLRLAQKLIKKALEIKGIPAEEAKELLKLIEFEKKKAEKDNETIYVEQIPDIKSLPSLEILGMITPKFPPLVDLYSPIPDQENLVQLVPPAVLGLNSEYSRLIESMVEDISGRIQSESNSVSSKLEEMSLPQKLDALDSQEGLPESVWNKVEQIQAHGGQKYIEQSLAALDTQIANNENSIKDLLDALNRDVEEEENYRAIYAERWPRQPSPEYSENVEKLEELENEFKELGLEEFEVYVNTEKEFMEVLEKTKEELDSSVPVLENEGLENLESVRDLKEALESLIEKENEVESVLNSFIAETVSDNIMESLMEVSENIVSKDEVFSREIEKFSPKTEEIMVILVEIKSELEKIQIFNQAFDEEIGKIQVNSAKQRFLEIIERACNTFNEINERLIQLYHTKNSLSLLIVELQETVSDYITSRNIEKSDIIEMLENQPANTQSSNPYLPISNPPSQIKKAPETSPEILIPEAEASLPYEGTPETAKSTPNQPPYEAYPSNSGPPPPFVQPPNMGSNFPTTHNEVPPSYNEPLKQEQNIAEPYNEPPESYPPPPGPTYPYQNPPGAPPVPQGYNEPPEHQYQEPPNVQSRYNPQGPAPSYPPPPMANSAYPYQQRVYNPNNPEGPSGSFESYNEYEPYPSSEYEYYGENPGEEYGYNQGYNEESSYPSFNEGGYNETGYGGQYNEPTGQYNYPPYQNNYPNYKK